LSQYIGGRNNSKVKAWRNQLSKPTILRWSILIMRQQ
jgi:hypothetical protein